ncbi:MAG TPA: hypothetical protein VHT96_16730 [Clostridia bacterium]|nr:hypothetical protein [Clostridia bacterium]
MSRFTKCLIYQIKTKIMGTLIFLGYYFAISLALLALMSISGGNYNSTFSFVAGIFIFVYVIVDYRSKTNYLLMYGNTRKNIFAAAVLSNIAISIFLTAISAVASIIEGALPKFTRHYLENGGVFKGIYPESNFATEMLYILGLLILISSVSTIYGALAYKFGKAFSVPFWVVFGLSFMSLSLPGTIGLVKAFFCYGMPNGILLAPINFMVTALILYAASYAAARRQPQVA